MVGLKILGNSHFDYNLDNSNSLRGSLFLQRIFLIVEEGVHEAFTPIRL